MCGRRIDRYLIEHWLGGGGFGAVYRATHTVTQRPVALKLLNAARRESADAIDRLVREARAASSIGHPGIVQVLDAGRSEDGVPFIVMELVEGVTLAAELSGGVSLPAERAIDIALELLDMVAAAHAAGVVHRDIKPANVIVGDAAGHVRLLDFGISKLGGVEGVDTLTSTGVGMGTPGYAAPEQFLSAHHVDARADLYAIGVVLYRMLSGRMPFAAGDADEHLMRALTERPTPLLEVKPDLPASLAEVVHRALSRDPDARHGSAEEMARALARARSGEEVVDSTLPARPAKVVAPASPTPEMEPTQPAGEPAAGADPGATLRDESRSAAAPTTAGPPTPPTRVDPGGARPPAIAGAASWWVGGALAVGACALLAWGLLAPPASVAEREPDPRPGIPLGPSEPRVATTDAGLDSGPTDAAPAEEADPPPTPSRSDRPAQRSAKATEERRRAAATDRARCDTRCLEANGRCTTSGARFAECHARLIECRNECMRAAVRQEAGR